METEITESELVSSSYTLWKSDKEAIDRVAAAHDLNSSQLMRRFMDAHLAEFLATYNNPSKTIKKQNGQKA